MEFEITCDIFWETRVDDFLDITNDETNSVEQFFQNKKYGEKPDGIFIVLMCRQPNLNFKQRKRYSKKENTLYLDVMLNYKEMMESEQLKRNEIITRNLIEQLLIVMKKYNFPKFNLKRFENDLNQYFLKSKTK